MKKTIPFISPLLYGFFGGLLIASIIQIMGIVCIPGIYVDFKQLPPVLIFLSISILSLIFIALVVFTNVSYLVNLDDKRRTKLIMILEFITFVIFLFFCWSLWNPILIGLLDNLIEVYSLPQKVHI